MVLVEVGDLTHKPENVSWEVAGSLYVVGSTAWRAVHAVPDGLLQVPIARVYPLDQVREA
ncbi:hypothetical protein ABZ128_05185 [Streptomyces sp. NPDC006326]|uniref:hypothetical protein n=1 Tax=Streptomyces sp. NPDC006326 TaxID=3156752 RepID=UPI0033AC8451